MSDKDKLFTVIWDIQNFSSFKRTDGREFLSPSWSIITTKGSVNFELGISLSDTDVIFKLHPSVSTISDCDISLIASREKVRLKKNTYHSNSFYIGKYAIFGSYRSHVVLQHDILTVCCTMNEEQKNTEKLYFCSKLHTVNFTWFIEKFTLHSLYDCTFMENDDGLQIYFTLVKSYNSYGKTHILFVGGVPVKDVFYTFLDCKLSFVPESASVVSWGCPLQYGSRWIEDIKIKESLLQIQFECIVAINKEKYTPTSSSESIKTTVTPVDVQDLSGTLTSDLLHLYKEKNFSDATLKTEGKSFSVHKNILSARSSVFKAMFENQETTEGRSGVVKIEDIDSDTVQRLLVFLYSESLDDMPWEVASKLYYAANKYAVQLLKQKCAGFLKAGLTVSNACDAVVLADRHSDEDLMKCAVDYIRGHQEVISSSDWESLEKCDPGLAAKILRQVFVKTGNDHLLKEKGCQPNSSVENNKTTVPSKPNRDPAGTLTSDLLQLYKEKNFSDATLKTEGKSFSAHKNILSARSSVFKAMFEKQETTEGRSGVVNIEDIDSDIVHRLLVFLYSESLDDMQWEAASKLYYAADKYAVQLLKQKCADFLKAGLTVSNVCDAAVLADRHSDDDLMKCATDYIRDHQEVISSSDWESLEKCEPRLAAKILRQIFVQTRKK